MSESKVERQKWVAPKIKDYYLSVLITIMKCVVIKRKMNAPNRLIYSYMASIKLFT